MLIFRHFANMCNYGNCAIRIPERDESAVHLDSEGTVIIQCGQRIIPFGKRPYKFFVCHSRGRSK